MTIVQRRQQRPSKKITYLLKECRNEMNEMKCELFDIQTALNACRTSLKTLNISNSNSNSAAQSRNLSPDIQPINFAPILNSTKKSNSKKIKQKKNVRRQSKKNDSLYSSSLDSESVLSQTELSLADSSTYTYPSTSTYKFNPHMAIPYKTLKNKPYKNKRTKNPNLNCQLISTRTTTTTMTTTTDEYSTRMSGFNTYSSRLKKYGLEFTPVKCTDKSKRNKNNYRTIHLMGNRANNLGKQMNKNSNHQIENLFDIDASTEKQLNVERSLFRPLQSTMSPISSSSRSDRSSNLMFSKSSCLKDHFLVINHKTNDHNQTIFEPKGSSTPIKKYPKTSTPNLINNSYFENILKELDSNSKRFNLMSLKSDCYNSKDSNKHSDYFSSSTHLEDNEYDLPEHRAKHNEYEIPNCKSVNFNINSNRDNLDNLAFSSTLLKSSNFTDFNENFTKISTLTSSKFDRIDSGNYIRPDSLKNLTVLSTASSVRSSVINCCIKPFRLLYSNKNMKKNFKKNF